MTTVTLYVTLNNVDNYHDGLVKSVTTTPVLHLGGFQEAADTLSLLTKKKYSRQGVHQLWKRRTVNGFPDRKHYLINGYSKLYFDMNEIETWYLSIREGSKI